MVVEEKARKEAVNLIVAKSVLESVRVHLPIEKNEVAAVVPQANVNEDGLNEAEKTTITTIRVHLGHRNILRREHLSTILTVSN